MTFPFLQTLLFSFMDLVQFYVIANKMHHGTLRFRWMDGGTLAVVSGIVALISFSLEGIYPLVINQVLLFFLAWVLYRRPWKQSLFLYVLSMTLLMIVQLLVISLLNVITGTIEFSQDYAMLAQGIGVGGCLLLARYVPLHLLFRYVEVQNRLFQIVSMNLFPLMMVVAVCWDTRSNWTRANVLWLSTMAVLILFINLIFLREGLKNRLVEEQNRAYEQYLPIVSELIDEIRVRQHDVNNHLSALKIVLEQKKEAGDDVGLVENYVEDIESALHNTELIRMENKIVAGFLYSKRKQAEASDIALHIAIETGNLTTVMKDYEVLEMLSILVDNAFETGVEGNSVRISFFQNGAFSVVEVANKHPYVSQTDIQSFFSKKYSTKAAEGRGLGLHKLQKLLREYDTEVQVCNMNLGTNYLSFIIRLPLTAGS